MQQHLFQQCQVTCTHHHEAGEEAHSQRPMLQDPASIVALNHIQVPVSATKVILARWHVLAYSRGQSVAQGHNASSLEEGGCGGAAVDWMLQLSPVK
jgi:hypothetical protein